MSSATVGDGEVGTGRNRTSALLLIESNELLHLLLAKSSSHSALTSASIAFGVASSLTSRCWKAIYKYGVTIVSAEARRGFGTKLDRTALTLPGAAFSLEAM